MQSLKRDITSGLLISTIAVAVAVAWGSPFVGQRSAHADEAQAKVQQVQQQQEGSQAKAKPHPGTLSRAQVR
jgi:hypothetical protein